MSTNLQSYQSLVNGIFYNIEQNRYELWERGKMTDSRNRSFHPAFDLAVSSSRKNPHLTGTAWRGAIVIVDERIRLQPDGSATFSTGQFNAPYVVRSEMVEDAENWQYDRKAGRNIHQLKRALTCTCESYQRNAPIFKGNRMCKHIWAFQAQERINATVAAINSLATVIVAIHRANRPTTAVDGQTCVYCGIQFAAGQPIFNGSCTDDNACMSRTRENRDMERLFKATRSQDAYRDAYNEWYNSPDGARRYAMVALSNGAGSLKPEMYNRATGRR